MNPKPERNASCPCGSGRKYKQCCQRAADQVREQAARRNQIESLRNRAVELTEAHRDAEAEPYLARWLKLDPHNALAFHMLGDCFAKRGDLEKAAAHYARSLELDPAAVDVASNLGACLAGLGRRPEALKLLCDAVEQNPGSVAAWSNLGIAAKSLGDLETALLCFGRALNLEPKHANSRWNRALCLLGSGRLAEGWAEYDWRWKAGAQGFERIFPQPAWDGGDLRGKTILVWMEQGLGDQIFFASMLGDLMRMGAHCVVECESRLVSLFQRSFAGAEVVPRSTPAHPRTQQPDIDFQIAAGSLPRFLRPTLESFPRTERYLIPDPALSRRWKEGLNQLGPGLKAGICWRSSAGGGMRAIHYAQLNQWAPILSVPGVHFVNLQYDECSQELLEAERLLGTRIHVLGGVDLKQDQDSVAALISALDLVVSARTAVAAMAGAVGTRVMALSRSVTDWWGFGTGYCPWQARVQAFLCGATEPWEPAIQRIASEIRAMASRDQG